MRTLHTSRGLSVVEIVVGAAILLTVTTGVTAAWKLNLAVNLKSAESTAAGLLTEEASEAFGLMRDASWTSNISPLALNSEYELYWSGTAYQATTSVITLMNQYVRTFKVLAVNRDATTDDIVSTGGTTDSNTRKITISVSRLGATSTPIMRSEILLHNVYSN